MATSRIDVLKSLIAQNPHDPFTRYGLAMEYVKSGEWSQAMEEFRAVLAADPEYSYAYFHGGQALEKQGLFDQAREWYEKGIAAARENGDGKAESELEAALGLLPL